MRANLMHPWWQSGGCSCAGFTPANLNLTGFWDAPYTGAPVAGVASLGSSGTKSLITTDTNIPRTHTAPTGGTAVNGFTPMSFDGHLYGDISPVEAMQLNTPDAFGNYASGTGFSFWALVYPTLRGAPNSHVGGVCGVVYNDADGTSPFLLDVSGGGLVARVQPAGGLTTSLGRAAAATDTWVLASFDYDGANMRVGLNEIPGAFSGPTPYSTPLNVATVGQLNIGMQRFVLHIQEQAFAGDMLQIGTANYRLTDNEWCRVLCAARTKYNLPLVPP